MAVNGSRLDKHIIIQPAAIYFKLKYFLLLGHSANNQQ